MGKLEIKKPPTAGGFFVGHFKFENYPLAKLLHGNALGQVPGLVHVGAARHRGVVGQQLQRHHVHDG